jgi:hypothetical protein
LYRLTNDDDFQNELGKIRERHQNEIDEMSQELSQMEEEEQAIGKALTQKYGVEFISSQ